jgi:murein DD-endopeptidase MepM/ murein hydrolase activator NlpD
MRWALTMLAISGMVAAGLTAILAEAGVDYERLRARRVMLPVAGVDLRSVQDTFTQKRNGRRHQAADILAPRGTPVIAADDGTIRKFFSSKPGGLTIYQFDPGEEYCYYYAHLDRYAAGLAEGQRVKRGELIGYVGTTGNARPNAPHLHFAIFRLGPEKHWWQGTAIDPYPLLIGASP